MASSTLGKKSPLQANAKKEKKADNWKCQLQWRHHHVPVAILTNWHPTDFPRFGAFNQRARSDIKSQTLNCQQVRGVHLLALPS